MRKLHAPTQQDQPALDFPQLLLLQDRELEHVPKRPRVILAHPCGTPGDDRFVLRPRRVCLPKLAQCLRQASSGVERRRVLLA